MNLSGRHRSSGFGISLCSLLPLQRNPFDNHSCSEPRGPRFVAPNWPRNVMASPGNFLVDNNVLEEESRRDGTALIVRADRLLQVG